MIAPTTKKLVDECVSVFLQCADSVLSQARDGASGYDGITAEQAQGNARRAWSALSRARLFVIDPRHFGNVLRAADRHVQALAGIDPSVVDSLAARMMAAERQGERVTFERLQAELREHFPTPESLSEKLIGAWEEHGFSQPFPEPLPFDACFFAYGRAMRLRPGSDQLSHRVRDEQAHDSRYGDIYLVGHLLGWEGDEPLAFSFIEIRLGNRSEIGVIRTYGEGEWDQPGSMDPWILPMLVRSINEYKQIVQDYAPTLAHRFDQKKASKQLKQRIPLPAPFYVVNLTNKLIVTPQQQAHKPGIGKLVEWSHRWDVRGHECVRVERGELPVPPSDVARLKRRGYRIYEGVSLSREDSDRLLRRGVRAPSPREWIAVLSYWRESFVKGPKGKPYVPAARVEG